MNTWTGNRGLGWAKYAWLVYLVFYFGWLALRPSTPRDWLLSTLAVAVFLPLYFQGFKRTGRALLAISSAIYGLGVVVMPINPGANCFFIYAIAFVAFAGSPALAVRWLILMLAGILLQAWAFGWEVTLWVPTVLVAAVVGATNINFADRRRRGLELQIAREAVEEMARIAERERIGRDLHDLLGHTLSVIVLKSELASKLADRDPVRAVSEIRDVERISRETLAEVRKAVRGYRSDGLDDEIANVERVLVAGGIRPVLNITRLVLAPDEERALAFALREAVTNVVRHAQARHCWITLRAADGRALLEVKDDGLGGSQPEGSGLLGMRERLRQLAGTVERDGQNGTRLVMTLPLGHTSAAGATS
jgi:two-component system, NarL family, sensor histidine kinase DesK